MIVYNAMLEISYLTKKYGAVAALNGVTFSAVRGQIVGLLGPNGAGKSSLMNIVSGLVEKSSGKIYVCGFDIDTHPSEIRRNIGYLPEQSPLPINMTVNEFLEFSSDLKKVPKQQRKSGIDGVVEMTGLTEVRRRLIRNLSRGFKQRVGIAQALVGSPDVLIFDEPTSGLDPSQLIEVHELMRKLAVTNTVLFSSHILSEVEAVCDRVVVLYKGRVLSEGKLSEMTSLPENEYRLSSDAPQVQIANALADAGITFSELVPISSSLEDNYNKLIYEAERKAWPRT